MNGIINRGQVRICGDEDIIPMRDDRERRRFSCFWVQLDCDGYFDSRSMGDFLHGPIDGDLEGSFSVFWRERSRVLCRQRKVGSKYAVLYLVSWYPGQAFASVEDIMEWMAGSGLLDEVYCHVKVGWEFEGMMIRVEPELLPG